MGKIPTADAGGAGACNRGTMIAWRLVRA